MRKPEERFISPPREELIALYQEDGLSLDKLSKHYSVSRGIVTRWMAKHGIAARSYRIKVDMPPREELAELYHDELSLDNLSEHYGVSRTTMTRWMNGYAIELRPQGPIRRVIDKGLHRDEKRLRELYVVQRIPIKEIASRAQISVATVYRWLQRYKISRITAPPSRERLLDLYKVKNMSIHQVAMVLGCSRTTATKWLDTYGIQRRGQQNEGP